MTTSKNKWLFKDYTFEQEIKFKKIRNEIELSQSPKEFILQRKMFDDLFMYSFYFGFMFFLLFPENYPLF